MSARNGLWILLTAIVCFVVASSAPSYTGAQPYQGVSDVSLGRFAASSALGWYDESEPNPQFYEGDVIKLVYPDHILKDHKDLNDTWSLYFGACEITRDPGMIADFEAETINDADIWPEEQNWVYKKFAVVREGDSGTKLTGGGDPTAPNYLDREGYTYTVSVNNLGPGTRIQTKYDMVYLKNSDHGFGYAAFQKNNKTEVRGDFTVAGDTCNGSLLGANWVLLFDSGDANPDDVQIPVLVSFSHRPRWMRFRADYVEFDFSDKPAGEVITVFLSLPFGAAAVESSASLLWSNGIPSDVRDRCQKINRLVTKWPVGVEESYQFDDCCAPVPPRVVIRNDFLYSYMGSSWDPQPVPAEDYTLIPPVLGLATETGLDVGPVAGYTWEEAVDDGIIGFPTKHGPLYMVEGANSSEYTIPGAPEHDIHLVGSTYETIWNQMVNRMVNKSAIRRQIDFTDMFSLGNFGVSPSLAMADAETREHYIDFMRRKTFERVLDPVQSAVSIYAQWRYWSWGSIDPPPDGSWPPFWAYLYRDNLPVIIPGDIDATAGLLLEHLYEYGLWSGDWDGLDARWDTGSPSISGIFEPLKLFHDWAFMAGFHDVYGGKGCHMDMFAGQLAGYEAYGKMAAALGRDGEANLARYLAAKAQIPFVTRWAAKEYVSEHYHMLSDDPITGNSDVNQIVAGFGEYEPSGPLSFTAARTTDRWADWTVSGERIHLLGYDILRTILDDRLLGESKPGPFYTELLEFSSQSCRDELTVSGEYSPASFPEDKLYAFFRNRDILNMTREELIDWVNVVCTDRVKPESRGEIGPPRCWYENCDVTNWRAEPPEYQYTHGTKPSKNATFPLLPAVVEAYGVPVRLGSWAPAKLVSAVYDRGASTFTAEFEPGDQMSVTPIARFQVDASSQPPVNVTNGGTVTWDDTWKVVGVTLAGAGPWTVEISPIDYPWSCPESWDTIAAGDPNYNNLVSDYGFENSGRDKPNYEKCWIPWGGPEGYPGVHTTTDDFYPGRGNQSARLELTDGESTALLWQYVLVGDDNQLDINFKYRLNSCDVKLNLTVKQYDATLDDPASTKLGSDSIDCVSVDDLWHEYSWTRPLRAGRPIVGIYFALQRKAGCPPGTHQVYIDDIVAAKSTVACALTDTVTVTTTYNAEDHTWNATFTFDTSTEMTPAVVCGPDDADCGPCSYDYYKAGVPGTHHEIQIEDLAPAEKYCYEVIGCEQGQFQLTGGLATIYDISDSFDPTFCKYHVEWYTNFLSANNKVEYRKTGSPIWNTAISSHDDCREDRWYHASFSTNPAEEYEFRISTDIDGVTYYSDVITRRTGQCDEDPPDPQGVASAEELKDPFVRTHPNPFNPTTTLVYNVVTPGNVDLVVYAADGSVVRRLVSGRKEKGVHTLVWDSTNDTGDTVATGIYFVKFTTANEVLTQKLVLLK